MSTKVTLFGILAFAAITALLSWGLRVTREFEFTVSTLAFFGLEPPSVRTSVIRDFDVGLFKLFDLNSAEGFRLPAVVLEPCLALELGFDLFFFDTIMLSADLSAIIEHLRH